MENELILSEEEMDLDPNTDPDTTLMSFIDFMYWFERYKAGIEENIKMAPDAFSFLSHQIQMIEENHKLNVAQARQRINDKWKQQDALLESIGYHAAFEQPHLTKGKLWKELQTNTEALSIYSPSWMILVALDGFYEGCKKGFLATRLRQLKGIQPVDLPAKESTQEPVIDSATILDKVPAKLAYLYFSKAYEPLRNVCRSDQAFANFLAPLIGEKAGTIISYMAVLKSGVYGEGKFLIHDDQNHTPFSIPALKNISNVLQHIKHDPKVIEEVEKYIHFLEEHGAKSKKK
jgi:hypothetical protein